MFGLKRKRSDSELSLSSSSASSSPASGSRFGLSFLFPSTAAAVDVATTADAPSTSRRLFLLHNSRTRKRFRDNRPSEDEVHQHTLDLLYAGQQQQHAHPQIQHEQARQPPRYNNNNQTSLHSFWNLPRPVAALSSVTSLAVVGEELLPMSCEDCGAGLGQGGTGGTEPQHDDYGCCGACRKAVCFSCSVTNLGEQRRCLACAGRKIGVGGLGWTVPSASVC